MAEPLQRTAWVAPAYEAGGLDHLGVKAPIIHIYGDFLPGLTNVTDRLRYYSFYTWLIWSLEARGERSIEALRHAVRHGDCLFTLIAEFHALTAPGLRESHSAATVGNSTLAPVAQRVRDGEIAALSEYASEEPVPSRYFQNRLGGLGQYYLGSLRDVLLLSGDGSSGIRFTAERGRPLAEAFDRAVDGERFWRCIDSGSVTLADLEALVGFCPCQLATSDEERHSLAQVLFALDEHVHVDKGPARRASLQLLLHLAKALAADGAEFSDRAFRGAVYGGALPDGSPWQLLPALVSSRSGWGVYATNEILSMGLQGLFFAILKARLEAQGDVTVASAGDMVAWFLEEGPGAPLQDELGSLPLANHLDRVEHSLPDLGSWQTEDHELALACRVHDEHRHADSAPGITEIARLSVRALSALAVRLRGARDPYLELTFPPSYFKYFPLNLRSFQHSLEADWARLSVRDWLRELATNWCVNAHIRVALRKLRNQSTATFQVKPMDQGLWVTGAPEPQFTSPRFYQARRILADLGALAPGENERYTLTPLGRRLMVAGHD